MRPFIVGLCGKKQSGKDTAFGIIKTLAEADGFTVQRVAFADALKAEVAEAIGTNVEEIERNKEYFRPILQWWGQFRRDTNEDYWISIAHRTIDDFPHDIVVITDIRYLNEVRFVRGWGGVISYLDRIAPQDGDGHISEVEMGKFSDSLDWTITNTDLMTLADNVRGYWELCVLPAYYGSKRG